MQFSNLQLNYCWQELEDIHDRIDPSQLQMNEIGQKAQETVFPSSEKVLKRNAIIISIQPTTLLTKPFRLKAMMSLFQPSVCLYLHSSRNYWRSWGLFGHLYFAIEGIISPSLDDKLQLKTELEKITHDTSLPPIDERPLILVLKSLTRRCITAIEPFK